MPRAIDSVHQGGYAEPIDVDEVELDKVVALLELNDRTQFERARKQIYNRLEDLKTDRSQTAKARPIKEDVHDLSALAKVMDPTWATEHPDLAMDALESLQVKNPVLYQRLQRQLNPRRIPALIRAVERRTESIEAVGKEVRASISGLREAIALEDGRGAPTDYASRRFASGLFQIWTQFTGRGTARHNATGRECFPFGEFVEAAGRLVDPDFDGLYVARQIHEASREKKARPRRA